MQTPELLKLPIAAALGGPARNETAPPPPAAHRLIGQNVVVRDHRAGVYWGRLVALDLPSGTWELASARQAWEWTGAAATPGLAARGPKGGKIGPVRDAIGCDLVSVIPTTAAADVAWSAQPEWMP